MALDTTSIFPTEIEFNGISLDQLEIDGITVWSKPYTLSIAQENATITVSRKSSLLQEATLGDLSNGATLYNGDVIDISITVPNNFICTAFKVNGISYSSNVSNFLVQKSVSISTEGFVFNNYGLTLSGNSVTKWDNSSANASLTIPSSYYYISDYSGTTRNFISGSSTYNGTTSITGISANAFQNCANLKSVTIPSSVKTLGNNCFSGCTSLTTVTMSATPTSIGQYAFAGTKLSSLPSSLYNCTSLGTGCFATNTAWRLTVDSSITAAQAEKVRATTTGATGTYNGVSGYGGIYASYGYTYWQKTSGDNGTSGSITTQFTFNAGIQSWSHSVTSSGSGVSTSTYLYNSSNNPPSISGSVTGQSLSNVSSTSNQSSIGYYTTSNGLYCYRLDYWRNVVTTCLVEGTLITLADGTYKNVEDLNYNDLLRVWNLETGKFDIQYPLAIVKGEQHGVKYRLTIEDGTYLEICGQHDIFDPEIHRFRTYGEGAIYEIDPNEDYYVMKDIGTDEFLSQKIMNIEIIHEDVTAYGIITSGTITTFANDMMIGLGVLNLVPITEENKFDKVFETLKESCYTYDRLVEEIYSDVEEDLAIGLNLLMTDIYHKDASGLPNLVAPFRNRKPLPNYKGKKLHYLALDDGELTIIRSFENELTVLPEIKTPGKTKWYIVGEYKYLEPGDTYITKFSTVIKAV